MKCPNCGASLLGQGTHSVIDSRLTSRGAVRRRRECVGCKSRVTTYEVVRGHDEAPVDAARMRETLESLVRQAQATLSLVNTPNTPEAEGTDRPQRSAEVGSVDNAVGVGSSR
jgi:transcriptional regulator NrdR family protein